MNVATDLQAWLSIGHTHRQAGRLEPALDAFQRAIELWPTQPSPHIEAARIQYRLGRHAASRKLLLDLLEMLPEQAEARLELAEQARLAHDLEEAEALFRRVLASQPFNIAAAFGLSQVLTELGKVDDALQLLAELGQRHDAPPETSARQVEILRRIGRWDRALLLVRDASADAPGHCWLCCQLAEMEMLTGHDAAAEEALRQPPAVSPQDWASVFHLRGQLAELQWQFDAAIEHYRQVQALTPKDVAVCNNLARVLLLSLDVPGAREQLRQAARLQGDSFHISHTLLSHILDEYAIDAVSFGEMAEFCRLPPAERIGPLLGLVRRAPDYTPAAITWLIALRQANRLPAAAPAEPAGDTRCIPRRIVQYWEPADTPADLRRLMQSWRDATPGVEYRLFDDRAAQDFLCRHAPEALRAYRRATEAVQKADIFRLAWLFECGGYYADPEDRCLASIETLIPARATLALYQEDFGTIGNRFIGAAPRHGVIGRALDLAVEAVNRGDRDPPWFSTGPGLLTRAFAQVMADSGLDLLDALDGLVVLGRGRLHRVVTFHCRIVGT